MRYDHFSMLPEKAFQPRNGRRGMTLEGGSGGGQPTQTSQITIPKYMQPYAESMIGQAGALTGVGPDAGPSAGYQIYGGERLASVTPEQAAARGEMAAYGGPQQFGTATDLATAGGLQALQAGQYDPSSFTADQVSTGDLTQFQAGAPAEVSRGLGSFTEAGTADKFMSPYMQQVVDAEKQAATREGQMAQTQANLAAGTRTGALGSSAQTLAQAERERGLLDRLSGIQSRGSQAAFDQAQRAFEAEQGRGLQAGLQTQRLGTQADLANLQAKLGVQELGTRTGLEASLANQRANLEAAGMGEQSRQFGAGLGLQGGQAAAQAASILGQLGATEQGTTLDRLKSQEEFGRLGQERQQQALDINYQDYLNQQRYPYQQIEFMSNLLRGLPGSSQTMYQAQPSAGSQVAGAGLGLVGLQQLLGR
jgi:hypothetical protein